VINKFDISYPLNIHSRALLQAILSHLVALLASRVAVHFWCFRSRSALHCCIYVASASQ